jgi:peptide/nickel transport system ATP-binding protein
MVFQEPLVSLNPAMTVGAQMLEAQQMHLRLSRSELRRRAVEMLERVRIRQPARSLQAYPHEFSGGMRQRIMLASVMLLRPKLLIADEPTTALDTLSQREVLDLMTELTRETGTAVILISHNLGLVGRYAQRALVMRRGRLIEQGTATRILQAPAEPYTRALVASLPRRVPRPPVAVGAEAVITVRGLMVTYRGRRGLLRRAADIVALDGIDLDVHAGEVVAVVGDSGSGKTTLGRAILGSVAPSSGVVTVHGVDLVGAKAADLRAARLACQMVFQDPHSSLDPRMRVGDIVAESLRHLTKLTRSERQERVSAILDQVGLAGFERRYPHTLSGGQRQRVAIARAIVRRPAFIVADEPVSALDMTVQSQILALLRALQVRHRFACLFISHDLGAVEQVADRVVVMQAGRIVEQGSCEDVFNHPRHGYTRALLAATPSLGVARMLPDLVLPRLES